MFWKLVHETPTFRYEQHRLFAGKRRAVPKVESKRPPRHQAWLRGGHLSHPKKKKPAAGA
jgi:hypothetical protein